jgi:hypothetical protein
MRQLGWLEVYQYFFENQPHTHLSLSLEKPLRYPMHIRCLREVSAFYGFKENRKCSRANGNASLFTTDGIVAVGLWGIPIAGAVCAIVRWRLDGCTKNYAIEFSVGATTTEASFLRPEAVNGSV